MLSSVTDARLRERLRLDDPVVHRSGWLNLLSGINSAVCRFLARFFGTISELPVMAPVM